MTGLLASTYLVAGALFILSLAGLSRQDTARRGNLLGAVGMLLAVGVTVGLRLTGGGSGFALLGAALVAGGAIGAVLARRVEMTGMPELVAILHSFVGLAAVLVGLSTSVGHDGGSVTGLAKLLHAGEIFAGVAVGAVTFAGSVVAWGKLRGTITGKPLVVPFRHGINAAATVGCLALAVPFVQSPGDGGLWALAAMAVLAAALGAHAVLAIGGADMPVVVSLLNSYSGWAAAAAGFMLSNDLLIVTGALVGSSGAILSIIMCRAMNRSLLHVIFGGFGSSDAAAGAVAAQGEVQEIDAATTAERLLQARSVVIVPGYGMAVARAQNAVHELSKLLRERSIRVRFAIHPVAGRLPGHMNVLLAEAGVPYDSVFEMSEINADLPTTDVVLVIGANDIVNPSALDDPASPIAGMPVIEVWKSRLVVVLKRGLATGYAGVENPLFFHDGTRMLLGDACRMVEAVNASLRGVPHEAPQLPRAA